MSEPRRWIESDEVGDDVLSLLDAAAPPRSMTAAERRRTTRRVARMAMVPIAAGTMVWFKTFAYAAVVGGAGAAMAYGAYELAVTPSAPEVVQTIAPSNSAPPLPPPKRSVASAAVSTTIPEPSAEPETDSAPPPAPSASASAHADTLQEEAALLEKARGALAESPEAALAILSEHAQRFPKGKLGMEREMLTIDALQRAGRSSEAKARARALLGRSPGSLYEKRLRAIIGE